MNAFRGTLVLKVPSNFFLTENIYVMVTAL